MYLPNINIIIDIIIMGILFIRTNLYRKRTMTIGVTEKCVIHARNKKRKEVFLCLK